MTIYRKHNRDGQSMGDRIKRMHEAAQAARDHEAARNSDRAIIRQDDRASLDLTREILDI